MRIANIELTPERLIAASAAIVAFLAIAAYFFLYAPLLKEIRAKSGEHKALEAKLAEAYDVTARWKRSGSGRTLIPEKDISIAIDELAKYGRAKGISFISIKQKDIKVEKGATYKILPIEMNIESGPKELSGFLGSLDELKKSVIRVDSFKILRDRADDKKLNAEVIVDMYVSRRGDER